METFNIHLTRTTTETATISIEADTHAEAVETVLDNYHDCYYDDDFMHGDCDIEAEELGGNADDDLTTISRVTKIEELIEAGDYEEEPAVRDMLTDLRHYCDAHGIDFAKEDKHAFEHYREEKHIETRQHN